MIDLHEGAPEYFENGDELELNLEHLYKQHIGNCHTAALEAVYIEGMKYVVKHIQLNNEEQEKTYQAEIENLRDQFNFLQDKHQKLLVQVQAKNQKSILGEEGVTSTVVGQVMGMGNTLK